MKLGFLLLSDHSEALNGKIYAMGAGWNVLRFPQLPADHAFSIALGIDVPWDETNKRHALTLRVDDPDGARLGEPFQLEFETGRPPGTMTGQDQRITLSLGARMTFTTPGPHAVVVGVGGKELERSRFYVVRLPRDTLAGRGFRPAT